MKELLNKLQAYKLNGNHLTILGIVDNDYDLKDYAFKFKIPLQEFNYLIRRGLITLERVGTGFNFETCRLTSLGSEILAIFESEEPGMTPKSASSKKAPKADITKQEMDLSWVEDWRKLFKDKRPGAGGSPHMVLKKMKTFLEQNPTVTVEEIYKATNAYFNSLDNTKYLQQADYFIKKGHESERLLQWVEAIREQGDVDKWDNVV
jgi:hypothetical protein